MTKRMRTLTLAVGLVLCIGIALVGGTLAYTTAVAGPVVNTFQVDPGQGPGPNPGGIQVNEDDHYSYEWSKDITVDNTGDDKVDVRVMLVPIVTKNGQVIACNVTGSSITIHYNGKDETIALSSIERGWTPAAPIAGNPLVFTYSDLAGKTTTPTLTIRASSVITDLKCEMEIKVLAEAFPAGTF